MLPMQISGDAAKTKWKNLRDSYKKFKRGLKGETGQARNYCKWPWNSQMAFLDSTLQYRLQHNNIATREIETERLSSEATSPLANNNDESNQINSPPEMFPQATPKEKVKCC